MSKSALDTLTAQYTDSENEGNYSNSDSPRSQKSLAIILKPVSRPPSPPSEPPEKKLKKKKKKSVRRLVSYQDDLALSDEENQMSSSSSEETEESEEESEKEASLNKIGEKTNINEDADAVYGNEYGTEDLGEPEKAEKYAHYGFTLPSEPKSKPSPELVDKIRILYEKMRTQHMDLNRVIQERKEFRNPSIYEKLIQFCDINELGTNYPPEIYDPLRWGSESYYEELARVQKDEMVRRQKKRKDSDKIEQATALARKVEKEAKKRKSKWDQPGPVAPAVAPTLTTRFTGTKGTVISAFGSLPKKPAL